MRRVFVAAGVDDETRHRLVHLLGERVDTLPGRAVPPGNWHVTLRFLGEIDDSAYERLLAALDASDLGERFAVRWSSLGAFPRPGRATVLWVGLDRGEELLAGLASRVDDAVDAAGLPGEDRPFNPHLTLSRIHPPEDVSTLVAGVVPLQVPMAVDRVIVYESRRIRDGVAYLALEEFPLA